MTDSQYKYQALMEDQRHNLAIERINRENAKSQAIQARASESQAEAAQKQAQVSEEKQRLEHAKYQANTWQYIGGIGERVYDSVQKIWSNGFGFLGNMIDAIKGVGSLTGKSSGSKPLFK